LVFLHEQMPGCPQIPISKFRKPILEKFGYYDKINQRHGTGYVKNVSGEAEYDTKVGACGVPLVATDGKIIGVHFSDHGFQPVTDDFLQFFRSRGAPTVSKVASPPKTAGPSNESAKPSQPKTLVSAQPSTSANITIIRPKRYRRSRRKAPAAK